jgi:hypothetical protein
MPMNGSPWAVGGGGAPAPARRPTAPPPGPEQGGGGGAFYDAPGRTNGSYNADHAGSDGAAPGWATDTIRNRYTDAMNRTGSVAERAEDTYLDRATNFDATDYVNKAAQGAWNQFMPQLNRDIGTLRGQQVGMGRLDTGFATEDEDRLVAESTGRFTDQLAQTAVEGAGLQLRNDQGLGDFGSQYGNRYLDLISGQLDQKTAQQNAKKGGGLGDWVRAGAGAASLFI